MPSPLVTVIVPIYNVERYLVECLDSIINQTYDNLEVICVVSNPTDNSLLIAQQFAVLDDRFKIICEPALGLSHARNTAMDVMNGEYVVFVDSDDYLKPMYIETLLRLCLQSDGISMCGYEEEGGDGHCVTSLVETETVLTGRYIMSQMMTWFKHRAVTNVVWNKMYRRDVIDEIRFPIGMIYEDEAVMYRLLHPRQKIAITPEKLYVYRFQRAGSITGADFSVKNLHTIEHQKERRRYLVHKGDVELLALADFTLFNDAGYLLATAVECLPSMIDTHAELYDTMKAHAVKALRNPHKKWWVALVVPAFMIEFAVWIWYVRVKQRVQTHMPC